MRFGLKTILILCFAMGTPLTAWAQATLDVTVIDVGTGTPAAGISVTLENPDTGFSSAAVTDERGRAYFGGLATSGAYVVKSAESGAYAAAQTTPVQLRSTFDRTVTLLLSRNGGIAADEILVVGRSITMINTANAEVSSSLTETELRALPVEARDVTRALFRLPNVTQATGFYPEAPNISINGANSLFTNYMIDGLDNNENFLGGQKFPIPVGFTQNVTVLANNYSAEFGRSANGIVNMTSKSGANDYTGEVFFVTRPGALVKNSGFNTTDLSGNVVRDDFSRYQGGVGIGGPIVQDKTFFYANVEYTRDLKDNQLVVPDFALNQSVGGTNEFLLSSLRLDHTWSDDWSSTLRFNYGRVLLDRQAGGVAGGVTFPSAANSQNRTSALAAFSTTYTGTDFIYEGRLQYSRFRWNYAASDPGPQVTVRNPAGQTIAVLGHPGYYFDDTENLFQTQHKLTFKSDRHTLKVGADIVTAKFSLTGGGNPAGNYTVRLNAAQLAALRAANVGTNLKPSDIPAGAQVIDYSVEVMPNSFGKRQTIYGFYAEDQFAVTSRLNVTAGVRWDYDSLTKFGSGKGEMDNIAPRASANYALTERMSLRGGVGLFYDKVPYTVISDALQGNSTSAAFKNQLQQLINLGILPAHTNIDRITFNGNLSVNPACAVYLACPTPAQSANLRETASSANLRILNPHGYKNPYALQATIGYQWQLADDLLFYTDAIYTQSRRLPRLVDLNAPVPFVFTGTPRSTAAADATRPLGPAVPGGARSIVVTDNGGRARYKALNFTVVKDKARDPYAYRLSYTLSRLKNDTDDLNFRAQDSNNFAADYGPSLNDRTHVISGVITVFPYEGLSFSIAGLLQSGQPINYIPDATAFGTIDLNGDGQSYGDGYVGNSDRFPGATRNSGRLPWAKTFDLGMQYQLPAGGNLVELRADMFNIFNANNLSGYPVNFTQSNQVQFGGGAAFVQRSAAPARTLQLSARYLF
ncbi:MAG: TonB-dependent receptor [Rhodospirillaceae bacterium]|nr:TonB-dependent receptor [Rhodospirillaceae bacterium]